MLFNFLKANDLILKRYFIRSVAMTTVTLNNSVDMPLLGLGTHQLKPPEIYSITQVALQEGYKLIDTATVYKNESCIGEVLKKTSQEIPRESIFVMSKLDPRDQGLGKARAGCLASMERLGLDYLDLYLIHWPGTAGLKTEDPRNAQLRRESWQDLETLYTEGKLRAIGVSNYTVGHLKELLDNCNVPPAVLQTEVHPYLVQSQLRKFCKERGIHVQAYCSLGSREGCVELMNDSVVRNVAEAQQRTSAQVLLRWALQHGMGVIPRTSKVERLKQNMDVFEFSLSTEQMDGLDGLNVDKHYCWNPETVK